MRADWGCAAGRAGAASEALAAGPPAPRFRKAVVAGFGRSGQPERQGRGEPSEAVGAGSLGCAAGWWDSPRTRRRTTPEGAEPGSGARARSAAWHSGVWGHRSLETPALSPRAPVEKPVQRGRPGSVTPTLGFVAGRPREAGRTGTQRRAGKCRARPRGCELTEARGPRPRR